MSRVLVNVLDPIKPPCNRPNGLFLKFVPVMDILKAISFMPLKSYYQISVLKQYVSVFLIFTISRDKNRTIYEA